MSNYDFRSLQNGSDIRGVALEGVAGEPVNLDDTAVSRLARGFLFWLSRKTDKKPAELTVTVGRDSRLSGEHLCQVFVNALAPYGARVLDCGMASTPAMFMSTVFPEFSADGAVMVTASHLPWNRNGLKFFSAEGGLNKGDITDIIIFAESDQILNSMPKAADGAGAPDAPKYGVAAGDAPDLMDVYSAHLRSIITSETGADQPLCGMKIAVDAGNGAGGFYATRVLEPLGADISASQFLEPDGHFPNHQPNPENKEAMKAITDTVLREHCDLGLIFDTDVDRSSAVDENGREISRNGIVAMAAALIADKYPGTTVVTDSVTSDELHTYLEGTLGLKHLRFKRGYRNVINKSIELNAAGTDSQLAIETSGHAAYGDNYFLDDGAFLATRIVVRAARLFAEGKGISTVIADLAEPAESVEVRLPISTAAAGSAASDSAHDENAALDFGTIAESALEAVRAWSDGCSHGDMNFAIVTPNYEGVRVSFTGAHRGWFLIRRSLHDPILPLNIESEDQGGTDAVRALLAECLSAIPGVDVSPL